MKPSETTIIVAGGKGERMNASIPKQFLELDGEPILMHTLRKFRAYSPEMNIVLVLPASQIPFWKELCEKHRFGLPHTIVEGGEARFFSVKNALDTLDSGQEQLVAIHDGVRPLVSVETISRAFAEAEGAGTAIPVIDMIESLRKLGEAGSQSVVRSEYKVVQTPQVFRSEIILKSYEQPYDERFTDDASVVESAGFAIKLVEGNRENIKITEWLDLKLAEILMQAHEKTLK